MGSGRTHNSSRKLPCALELTDRYVADICRVAKLAKLLVLGSLDMGWETVWVCPRQEHFVLIVI